MVFCCPCALTCSYSASSQSAIVGPAPKFDTQFMKNDDLLQTAPATPATPYTPFNTDAAEAIPATPSTPYTPYTTDGAKATAATNLYDVNYNRAQVRNIIDHDGGELADGFHIPAWRGAESENSWTREEDNPEEVANIDENGRTLDTGVLVTRENAQSIFAVSACCFVAK